MSHLPQPWLPPHRTHQAINRASPINPMRVVLQSYKCATTPWGNQRSSHLDSGFYPVYRPVEQSVVWHMMVNVSDARRESRSRKSIRDIHHHKLEAWEFAPQGVFIQLFSCTPNAQHASTDISSWLQSFISTSKFRTRKENNTHIIENTRYFFVILH